MIIDSHAHYAHGCYNATFRYLTWADGSYALAEGTLPQLLQQLQAADIACSIEPGISLAGCKEVLRLCAENPGRIFPAIGIHPTRCLLESWRSRKALDAVSRTPGVAAIGETGLDYHYPRQEQHRLKQHLWFLYQLDLARRRQLPLILHIRDAHKDALRILRHHPARKLGGVVHCFNGSAELARQYLELGFHIGIGGAALQQPERSAQLWAAIREIPLERLLIETDAPFILPYCKDVLPSKQLRRARNTSLILPQVLCKIAQLKDLSPQAVADATARNAIALFRLPVAGP